MDEKLEEISNKLNVVVSLQIKSLLGDEGFSGEGRRKGVGDLINYLAEFGLEADDISKIVNSPVQSVRTLLTPKRRRK